MFLPQAAQARDRDPPPRKHTMPKKKTNKAAAKRCHVTGTGKVLATQAGKRHLMSHKSRKQKRNMRGTRVLGSKKQTQNVKAMLAS